MCDFEEKLKSLETTLSEFEQEILADPKSAFNRQACDFKKGEVRQEVNNAQKIMAQAWTSGRSRVCTPSIISLAKPG